MNPQQWGELTSVLTEVFKAKTRDEWCDIMEGTDVCFSPVLSLREAPEHHHLKARETYLTLDGIVQPSPAPRFSRSSPDIPTKGKVPGEDSRAVLGDYGLTEKQIQQLINSGIVTER